MQKVVCTYHKDCIDGTTAAAVVLRKFSNAVLFPLPHNYSKEDIAKVLAEVVSNTEVYTVDCGLGVQEFLERGVHTTTIDHHIGGKDAFEALAKNNPHYTYIFDNDKSGASLTWAVLFPNEEAPEVVKYVEDGDLWRFRYGEDTKYITNYLSMFRNDPRSTLSFFDTDLAEVKEKGKIITMYIDKEVENQIKIPPLTMLIGEHLVPAYNITSSAYVSPAGNILSGKLGKAVVLFEVRGEQVRLRFRAHKGQKPTGLELAKALGGGGHELTGGATISLEQFIKLTKKKQDD